MLQATSSRIQCPRRSRQAKNRKTWKRQRRPIGPNRNPRAAPMIVPGRSPDAMRDEHDARINQEKEPHRVARRILSREPNPFEIATGSCHGGVIRKLLKIKGTETTRANAEEPSEYRPKFAVTKGMTNAIRTPMKVIRIANEKMIRLGDRSSARDRSMSTWIGFPHSGQRPVRFPDSG